MPLHTKDVPLLIKHTTEQLNVYGLTRNETESKFVNVAKLSLFSITANLMQKKKIVFHILLEYIGRHVCHQNGMIQSWVVITYKEIQIDRRVALFSITLQNAILHNGIFSTIFRHQYRTSCIVCMTEMLTMTILISFLTNPKVIFFVEIYAQLRKCFCLLCTFCLIMPYFSIYRHMA